jgi:hypothetical protein
MSRKRATTQSLLTDVPLVDPRQDRLGRASFARSLAQSVLALKGDDSFVVGICDQWGSGKSSILNMMIAELGKGRSKNRPVILRFNPWLYSGRDQLLQAFLHQLGTTLDRVEKEKGPRNAAKMLDRFSLVLRPMSYLPIVGEFAKAAHETADDGPRRPHSYGNRVTTGNVQAMPNSWEDEPPGVDSRHRDQLALAGVRAVDPGFGSQRSAPRS